jgi:orotate phosphoribosyltransferase
VRAACDEARPRRQGKRFLLIDDVFTAGAAASAREFCAAPALGTPTC